MVQRRRISWRRRTNHARDVERHVARRMVVRTVVPSKRAGEERTEDAPQGDSTATAVPTHRQGTPVRGPLQIFDGLRGTRVVLLGQHEAMGHDQCTARFVDRVDHAFGTAKCDEDDDHKLTMNEAETTLGRWIGHSLITFSHSFRGNFEDQFFFKLYSWQFTSGINE